MNKIRQNPKDHKRASQFTAEGYLYVQEKSKSPSDGAGRSDPKSPGHQRSVLVGSASAVSAGLKMLERKPKQSTDHCVCAGHRQAFFFSPKPYGVTISIACTSYLVL